MVILFSAWMTVIKWWSILVFSFLNEVLLIGSFDKALNLWDQSFMPWNSSELVYLYCPTLNPNIIVLLVIIRRTRWKSVTRVECSWCSRNSCRMNEWVNFLTSGLQSPLGFEELLCELMWPEKSLRDSRTLKWLARKHILKGWIKKEKKSRHDEMPALDSKLENQGEIDNYRFLLQTTRPFSRLIFLCARQKLPPTSKQKSV